MIELTDWISLSVANINIDSYPKRYKIGFKFKDSFDARTDWSKKFIENVCNEVINVEYLPDDAALNFNDRVYSIRDFDKFQIPDGEILIDATSLAMPELLHLFTILNSRHRNFDVSYIEPSTYKEHETKSNYNVTAYDLSDDGLGVQQLPPFVGNSTNSRIFFFLGWEGHRLGGLINAEEFNIKNLTCLAGIPSYQVGWENTTLSCNFMNIKELNTATSPRFKFSGANDPVKTYKIIQDIYDSVKYEKLSLSIAPFGTKPSAIAAAQFAVNTEEASKGESKELIMLYDFVKIKSDKSLGTNLMHIWSFEYNTNIAV